MTWFYYFISAADFVTDKFIIIIAREDNKILGELKFA